MAFANGDVVKVAIIIVHVQMKDLLAKSLYEPSQRTIGLECRTFIEMHVACIQSDAHTRQVKPLDQGYIPLCFYSYQDVIFFRQLVELDQGLCHC